MQFGLTETQQTLKNTVRKFLAAECPMGEVRRQMETETAFDAALWHKCFFDPPETFDSNGSPTSPAASQ